MVISKRKYKITIDPWVVLNLYPRWLFSLEVYDSYGAFVLLLKVRANWIVTTITD
jgi:hypothetical protein